MKWSAGDTSNNGLACWEWTMWGMENRKPADVTPETADDVTCRMQAFTSRIFVSAGHDGQGFSDTYRRACERVAVDPKTPKYAAIDIIMWLTLSDPDILALKPGTLTMRILDNDESQISNCWKCLTTLGMSALMHGFPKMQSELCRAQRTWLGTTPGPSPNGFP